MNAKRNVDVKNDDQWAATAVWSVLNKAAELAALELERRAAELRGRWK